MPCYAAWVMLSAGGWYSYFVLESVIFPNSFGGWPWGAHTTLVQAKIDSQKV